MSQLGRSAVLVLLYLVCGVLLAAALLRAFASVVVCVRGDRSAGEAFVSLVVAAGWCVVLAIGFRALGALRVRWGVDFRRPRVHRSTFDV